jgi:hypothetical protein
MADISYRNQIWQQILDGKRHWTASEDAAGDGDLFFTTVVTPLRELRALGRFDTLEEVPFNVNGESYVGLIEIIGSINFDPDDEI